MDEFFKYTLPNGIRCIHKKIESPVCYCALTINAGSRDELSSEQGMAHFTEHSLFKGTTTRRAYHINSRLEKLGGELNAYTTKEETVVHATTLKGDLAKSAELISNIIFDSVFPEREIEREREVVIDEINSYKDSPVERIYDEFEDLLFAGSSLGHNILGTKSSVNRFKSDDIREFTQRCYTTDQMVVSVGADITEARFVKAMNSHFGDKSVSKRDFEREVSHAASPFEKYLNRGTHQAHCIIGSCAYSVHQPERTALSLLINILGGPAANSRLNVLLREKNGLTYNIDATYTPYLDTGIAAIYFGTDKDKVDRCVGLVNKVLTEMKEKSLTTGQLSMAKKQIIGQMSIALESKEWYMLNAGRSYMLYDQVDSPEQVYEKVERITASDIMEVANQIFSKTSSLTYNGRTR